MSRMRDLMEQAAVALEDGRDPLEHSFLVENAVTITECFDLADSMAAGLRFILVAVPERVAP